MSRRRTALGVLVLAGASLVGVATPAQAADLAPPQVNINQAVKPVLGTTLSDSTPTPWLSATVQWTANDPSGVTAQGALIYNYDNGRYYPVNLTANQRRFTYTFQVEASYRIEIYAQDGAGNAGWTYENTVNFALWQENSASLSAGWSTSLCNCWSGGGVVKNSRAGATATYTFHGTSITYIGDRAPDRGSARIYIDGVLRSTINMQSRTKTNRLIAAVRGFPTDTQHTIQVQVVGTAGHPRVDLDAFIIGI